MPRMHRQTAQVVQLRGRRLQRQRLLPQRQPRNVEEFVRGLELDEDDHGGFGIVRFVRLRQVVIQRKLVEYQYRGFYLDEFGRARRGIQLIHSPPPELHSPSAAAL